MRTSYPKSARTVSRCYTALCTRALPTTTWRYSQFCRSRRRRSGTWSHTRYHTCQLATRAAPGAESRGLLGGLCVRRYGDLLRYPSSPIDND